VQLRDLKLLRDTLSMEEVAAAFLARGNVGRKKKGIGLEELDVGGVCYFTLSCTNPARYPPDESIISLYAVA
jgi:hypothetical protein